jgi:hypothetical protein
MYRNAGRFNAIAFVTNSTNCSLVRIETFAKFVLS